MRAVGNENLGRQKAALRKSSAAMDRLRALGLLGGTIERLHLGLKQPYRSRRDGLEIRDALSFPLLSPIGEPLGRYGYINLPEVTQNPLHPKGWGPGPCAEYRLGKGEHTAVVAADILDLWFAWQCYCRNDEDAVFLARSHWDGWPAEWRSPAHWAAYDRVILLGGDGAADFIAEIAPLAIREILTFIPPPPFEDFADMVRSSQAPKWDSFLEAAAPVVLRCEGDDRSGLPIELGIFEAAPIDGSGGFAGGSLFYPVAVEQRAVDRHGQVVHRYETMVVRSDGALLSADPLPAPCGTASSSRVLALSDGTRIRGLPAGSQAGTWSFGSIRAFVEWRKGRSARPFRDLSDLLADTERYVRSRVWLPDDDAHAVVATFVAMTHVHQVFEALPILLAVGPPASGKSELGEAVARLSFNGTVAGQLRAAGMVRFLDETHGLLVLDDMDGIGSASIDGDGEIAQALKSGYKRSSARKPVADRGGRVRMVDFFGPKMISRTRLPTPVLGSRMIAIHTGRQPSGTRLASSRYDEDALDRLRDELHCWAMEAAADTRETWSRLPIEFEGRWEEITRPLRAIAKGGGDDFLARVETCLHETTSRSPFSQNSDGTGD